MKNKKLEKMKDLMDRLTELSAHIKSIDHVETWLALTDYTLYIDESFYIVENEYRDLLECGLISRGLFDLCWDLDDSKDSKKNGKD